MLRPFLGLSALALAAAPASAATYSATIAASAPARIAARDILWTCGSGTCTGVTQNSRPLVLCQGLAKQAGAIQSFLVDGREISAEDLGRCNASAKADGSAKVANAR